MNSHFSGSPNIYKKGLLPPRFSSSAQQSTINQLHFKPFSTLSNNFLQDFPSFKSNNQHAVQIHHRRSLHGPCCHSCPKSYLLHSSSQPMQCWSNHCLLPHNSERHYRRQLVLLCSQSHPALEPKLRPTTGACLLQQWSPER